MIIFWIQIWDDEEDAYGVNPDPYGSNQDPYG